MSDQLFAAKAPWIMNLLRRDFGIDVESAAAVLGNIGTECNGFSNLQEINPVAGRGGLGWCQWTGPRRVSFESYCKRNSLDTKSDKANYGYLFVELKGEERAAIPAVKIAVGLEAKVRAFEQKFERAGVKNYASRYAWAGKALAAWEADPDAAPPYNTDETPPEPPSPDDPGVTMVAVPNEPAWLVGLIQAVIGYVKERVKS